MSKIIIGLDLGTTSIGFAVVKEGENDELSQILKIGVRVNPLTTDEQTNFEKGKPVSVNKDRTLKRGARRNLQRYKQRRQNLINVLKKAGIRFRNAMEVGPAGKQIQIEDPDGNSIELFEPAG